jgi:surfactin synthase thioesterase subunit
VTVVEGQAAGLGKLGVPMSTSLVRFGGTEGVAVDLVCFPAAGEPAGRFSVWRDLLPATVGLVASERKGRGRRMGERPTSDLAEVADEAAAEIEDHRARPVLLLGHSAGSLVAHAVASRLEAGGHVPIVGVVACHGRSPVIDRPIPWATMADGPLADEIVGARPSVAPLFARADFAALFANAIRADLSLYRLGSGPHVRPIASPIVAVGGKGDTVVDPPDVWRWREATTGAFVGCLVNGGHFAPAEDAPAFLAELWPLVTTYLLEAAR